MKTPPKILITGSHGVIGKIVVDELKKRGQEVVLVDLHSSKPVDLLKDDLVPLFRGVETVIHLAANPNPYISKEVAQENIAMVRRVIDASSKSKKLKRIINASSINVYPYFEMYENRKTITSDTPLSPNLYYFPGEYARAKIKAERMFKVFCKRKKISLINLRFGHVAASNREKRVFKTSWKKDLEHKNFLHHKDLREIMVASIALQGTHNFLCVSNLSWLADRSIVFPLRTFRHADFDPAPPVGN